MRLKTIFILIFFGCGLLPALSGEKSASPKDQNVVFHVKWDGRIVPGVTKISGLNRKTEVILNRTGGDPSMPRRSPGVTNYTPIVIERPRGSDKEFERWANKVWNFGSGLGSEVSLKDFRKDILIELCTEDGKVIMSFRVYRCWPSEYTSLSELDKDSAAPAMEVLVLQHEGWERDYEVE
jgi:phage tail-like protein